VYTSHTFHVFHCSAPYFETRVCHCSALIGVITHSTCIANGSKRVLMTRNYTKGDIVSRLLTRKSSPFQHGKQNSTKTIGECKLYKGITNYIYNKYWGSTNTGEYLLYSIPGQSNTGSDTLTHDPAKIADPVTRFHLCCEIQDG